MRIICLQWKLDLSRLVLQPRVHLKFHCAFASRNLVFQPGGLSNKSNQHSPSPRTLVTTWGSCVIFGIFLKGLRWEENYPRYFWYLVHPCLRCRFIIKFRRAFKLFPVRLSVQTLKLKEFQATWSLTVRGSLPSPGSTTRVPPPTWWEHWGYLCTPTL